MHNMLVLLQEYKVFWGFACRCSCTCLEKKIVVMLNILFFCGEYRLCKVLVPGSLQRDNSTISKQPTLLH